MPDSKVIVGDCIDVLRTLPEKSFHTCVTSPPYFGLRDYGVDGQIGLEPTPAHFVATMVDVFREVRRVLRDDGTVWLNLGDSYAAGGEKKSGFKEIRTGWTTDSAPPPSQGRAPSNGVRPKNLIGIPWRVAFALQEDGWYLRSDIIWHKPNPMPESVRDRPTRAHEYLFLLAKSARYFYDMEAVKEPAVEGRDLGLLRGKTFSSDAKVAWHAKSIRDRRGAGVDSRTAGTGFRHPRTVWTITPKPFKGAHFATFPPALVEPCIKAGTSDAGCCPHCLAPWIRVVDRKRVATRPGADTKTAGLTTEQTGNRDPQRHVTATTTIGFMHDCGCIPALSTPCNVLDPFCGSGTTGLVAKQLGRSFVGIELNPEYAAMAEKRIECTR